jgi:hypothetical protein
MFPPVSRFLAPTRRPSSPIELQELPSKSPAVEEALPQAGTSAPNKSQSQEGDLS